MIEKKLLRFPYETQKDLFGLWNRSRNTPAGPLRAKEKLDVDQQDAFEQILIEKGQLAPDRQGNRATRDDQLAVLAWLHEKFKDRGDSQQH